MTRRYARRDDDAWHRIDAGGLLSVRDDHAGDAPDGRTVEGIAVPYGVPTRPGATREYGRARETFAPGAFRDWLTRWAAAGRRRLPLLDRHEGRVVGYADNLEERSEGLWFSGRLLDSPAARETADALGVIGAVSIEFIPGAVRRARDLVTHIAVAELGAIAATYLPAYAGATVAVRDDTGGFIVNTCEHCGADLVPGVAHSCSTGAPATTAAPAPAARAAAPGFPGTDAGELPMTREGIARLVRETADETMRRYAERGALGASIADPWADLRGFRSLGALVSAAAADDADSELVRWASRALADQLTTDNNAGVTTPGVVGDVRRLVDRGRPAITAFGGPRPLEGVGLSFTYPYYDGTLTDLVAEQTTQKTEIESAKVEIKGGSVTIKTYAGGSDIAYQLIRRSSPAYLDIYTRIILAAWAVVTNAAFVTALEGGSVTVDFAEAITAVDATELKGHLVDAAVAVDLATGTPAEFALAGTTAFKAAAKLLNPGPVFNAIGTMNLRQLEVNVGGLPIIHDPSVTAAKFIVSNREAAGWHEDGPFQATAEDVAKLGRNVAYWSLGAAAVYVPAAVVEAYDVTP